MSGSSKILLGFILGGMMSVDMGGRSTKRHMYLEPRRLRQATTILWQQL